MHTNWYVLIEISMKVGMLKFFSGIVIGHCTEKESHFNNFSWYSELPNKQAASLIDFLF